MSRFTKLGKAIGERARAAAEQAEADQAAKVTTKDSRAGRASWGEALVQLSQLLGTIGTRLLTSAYQDAEATAGQAHDRGYEQRRADEAEATELRDQDPEPDEHGQAAADWAARYPVPGAEPAPFDPPPFVPTIEGAGPAAAADAT